MFYLSSDDRESEVHFVSRCPFFFFKAYKQHKCILPSSRGWEVPAQGASKFCAW